MKKIMINSVVSAPVVAAMLLVGCQTKTQVPADTATELPPEEPLQVVETVDTDKKDESVKSEVPPASEVEVAVAEENTIYTIRKNDTISGVAARYGLRWQDVMAVNPGINPKRLRVGQTIRLPGKVNLDAPVEVKPTAVKKQLSSASTTAPVKAYAGPTFIYVVKKGDVLSAIALRNGVKVAAIRAANPKLKGDMIYVGQKLLIPAGGKKSGKTVKASASTSVKISSPAKVEKKEDKAAAPVVESKPVAPVAPIAPAAEVKEEVKPAAPVVEPKKEEVKVEAPVVAAPPAPQPAAPAANLQTYTVKQGEDVFAVAIRWGISVNALKELNNLTSNELKEGQVLRIPADSQQ